MLTNWNLNKNFKKQRNLKKLKKTYELQGQEKEKRRGQLLQGCNGS